MTDLQFEQIFSAYLSDVSRLSFYCLGNKEDAEDVTMEVFLSFYEKPPKDLTKTKPYLLRMTMNKAMDVLRKKKKDIPYDDAIMVKEEERPRGEEVLEALQTVPKKYRSVLTLYYLEGLNAAEVAATLGIKENAVYKRLQRGRAILKEEPS